LLMRIAYGGPVIFRMGCDADQQNRDA